MENAVEEKYVKDVEALKKEAQDLVDFWCKGTPLHFDKIRRKEGEEIDLGVFVKEQFRRAGFKSRSHIVKDYGETKGSSFGKGYHLQYYRNLKNDMNFFYGDNIFILKK